MKTNWKISRIEKTPLFEKKTKIGHSVLSLRKYNFKTKIIHFEKFHNAKNCKRGPLKFFNIHSVAKFQKKIKGNPLETLKIFE